MRKLAGTQAYHKQLGPEQVRDYSVGLEKRGSTPRAEQGTLYEGGCR